MSLLFERGQLLGRLSNFLKQSRISDRGTSTKRLMYEKLEEKNLFAGDIIVVPDVIESTELTYEQAVPLISETHEKEIRFNPISEDEGSNAAPVLLSFRWRLSGDNLVSFSGKVADDQPLDELVVHFGGLLNGDEVDVRSDGTFVFQKTMPPPTMGWVTAKAIDNQGLESNIELVYVNNP